MPVLEVARGQADDAETRQQSTSGGNGQSSSSDGSERIDLTRRLSEWAEDFVSGFIPGDSRVRVDWGGLSPIFSVIGDSLALLTFVSGWL